ncbi:MAG: alpha/beta hydrolase [Cyclobacteriaceae bacterium]
MKLITLFLIGTSIAAYAIKPSRTYTEKPDAVGLTYTEVSVTTPDRYKINVWEYAPLENTTPTQTIIFVGTDAGNMSNYIWVAKTFVAKGFRVISFDYRGFGHSADFAINTELLFHPEFAIDLDTVIKSVHSKYPTEPVGLMALSMGTYISLLRKEKIDFMVADGFYYNPQLVVDRYKTLQNKIIPLQAPVISVTKVTPPIPVLIFCASEDVITPTVDAREFARHNPVSIVEYAGKHLHGMSVLSKEALADEYIDKIKDFLKLNGL